MRQPARAEGNESSASITLQGTIHSKQEEIRRRIAALRAEAEAQGLLGREHDGDSS